MKLKFEFEKETKNTVRFTEVPDEYGTTMIGTIYVQKHALKDLEYKKDAKLIITIETEQ